MSTDDRTRPDGQPDPGPCSVYCLDDHGSGCLGARHACAYHNTVFTAPEPCPKGRGARSAASAGLVDTYAGPERRRWTRFTDEQWEAELRALRDRLASDRPDTQRLEERAEAIVRAHDGICVGCVEEEAPYCSCATEGTPLCSACADLANAIASEVRLQLEAKDRVFQNFKDSTATLTRSLQAQIEAKDRELAEKDAYNAVRDENYYREQRDRVKAQADLEACQRQLAAKDTR